MATLRPDQVRARIAATLEGLTLTTGTLGTLREAPCGYRDIPDGVPDQRMHLAFGVALSNTQPDPAVPGQRQTQGRPLRVVSTVAVRLLHKHRRSDAIADEDAAMAAESEVIQAVLGVNGASGLQVVYTGTQQRSAVSESMLIEIQFFATYHIATV
jgi:hypothetical protein